jgi:hypothetical protein
MLIRLNLTVLTVTQTDNLPRGTCHDFLLSNQVRWLENMEAEQGSRAVETTCAGLGSATLGEAGMRIACKEFLDVRAF